MTDTAQRVKQRPRRWEQDLLTIARIDDGQAGVDEMAESIASYNNRTVARLRAAQGADYREQVRISRLIDDDRRALVMGRVLATDDDPSP